MMLLETQLEFDFTITDNIIPLQFNEEVFFMPTKYNKEMFWTPFIQLKKELVTSGYSEKDGEKTTTKFKKEETWVVRECMNAYSSVTSFFEKYYDAKVEFEKIINVHNEKIITNRTKIF